MSKNKEIKRRDDSDCGDDQTGFESLDSPDQDDQDKIEERKETLSPAESDSAAKIDEIEQDRESLQLLYKLSRSLVKVVDPADVAHDALKLITDALTILRGEVLAVDEKTGTLKVLALVGYDEDARGIYEEQGGDKRLNNGLAWHVAQTKEAIALPDVNCSEHWLPIPNLDDNICSAAAIPLMADEKMSGVITLLSDEYDQLNKDRLQLLSAIATQVALALQNADLFISEQDARQTAEVLREANLELTKSLDIQKITATSLKYLYQLTHYDHAAILLLEEDDNKLHINAYQGCESEVEPRPLFDNIIPLDRYPLLQKVIEHQETLNIGDTQETDDWKPIIVGQVTRSWLASPLITGQKVVGLFVAGRSAPNCFSDHQRHLTDALASQAATAIQNGNLYGEIQANRNRLKRLADQLVNMQEAERQRVSRELHDETGQALNVLMVSLSLVHDELPAEFAALREQLEDAQQLVDQTLNRIRFISYDLRPPELDTLGLNAALEEYCDEFAQRTRLQIRYNGQETSSLPDTIKVSFYRFLQEALTNVVKHAEANQIEVTLSPQAGQICLSVTDNGKGFLMTTSVNSGQGPSGLGLIGMKERFEQLNGQLAIESKSNEGTKITACVCWEASE